MNFNASSEPVNILFQGDSGGPLYLWEEENEDDDEGAWVLIGQVSWGIGCAGQTPGVYADSAYYLDFFDFIIGGKVAK